MLPCRTCCYCCYCSNSSGGEKGGTNAVNGSDSKRSLVSVWLRSMSISAEGFSDPGNMPSLTSFSSSMVALPSSGTAVGVDAGDADFSLRDLFQEEDRTGLSGSNSSSNGGGGGGGGGLDSSGNEMMPSSRASVDPRSSSMVDNPMSRKSAFGESFRPVK